MTWIKPPNRHMLMVYGPYGICTVVLFMRAAADQSLQMPAPHSALAFMHVFKAGGTTFGVVLAKYAKANGIPFYTDMRQGRQLELPSYILSLNKRARHLVVDAPDSKNFSIFPRAPVRFGPEQAQFPSSRRIWSVPSHPWATFCCHPEGTSSTPAVRLSSINSGTET